MKINLVYNSENSFHKDLTLEIEHLVSDTQDSYFFALDNFILPDKENWEKVKVVVSYLLNKWEIAVREIDSATHLPFDFSDQYIGCLKVEKYPSNN
ncbi:hypothetical protein [Larkinella soli]|uniref:hypothetical protein n=1 Tax=Larkinella soli TaxID=1770527 RepID=UPI000FFC992A|nr:hypothetical protein [Larkinella soli]